MMQCCVFRKHIEVHGRPTPAVFRSSPEAGGRSSYLLTWTVDSYSPILEYRLLYRQIQPYHKVREEPANGPNTINVLAKDLFFHWLRVQIITTYRDQRGMAHTRGGKERAFPSLGTRNSLAQYS